MSFDAHKNFAYSSVATAPSPATSGTSLVVQAGDGAKFPAVPFNATVWPAGTQPTSANAEIVRVTARSTDTLTITRAQESTSARTVIVGDQIANTITAKVLSDIEAVVPGDISYAPAPTGVAATDTAAIQALHDALPSEGGEVILARGAYAIDPAGPLVFSKPITLSGQGGGSFAQTKLTFDSATGVAITIEATGVTLRDFELVNTHATAPTAGSGIQIGTSSNHAPRALLVGLTIIGFYICVDLQYPGYSYRLERCDISDFVTVGVSVQNLANADEGDGSITNCSIVIGPNNTGGNELGIWWQSSGGLRVLNNKLNCGTTAPVGSAGIKIQPQDGTTTSVLLIQGNSIEGYATGVLVRLGGSHTGVLSKIVVLGNEFLTTTACIDIQPEATGKILDVIVSDNALSGSTTGITIDKVDNFTINGNNADSAVTSPLTVGGSATNQRVVGMTKLFDTTLAADAASIDTGANGIPAGYSTLKVVILARSTLAAALETLNIALNNDIGGTDYVWEQVQGVTATASASQSTGSGAITFSISAASETANYASVIEIDIPAYDKTTFFKSGFAVLGRGLASANDQVTVRAFTWLSTAAINRLSIASNAANLKAGSRLIIYGLP